MPSARTLAEVSEKAKMGARPNYKQKDSTMHKIIAFLTILLLLSSSIAFSQVNKSDLTYDDVVYKREFNIGIKAHTNGFGLAAHWVKIHSIFKKTVYEFELMDLRHPREVRQQSIHASGRTTSRGYVFGKENSFYNLNVSIGRMKSLAEKARKSGVGVHMYYGVGVSLGILKPYHLDLIYDYVPGSVLDVRSESFNEENGSLFTNERYIYGASGFTYGLNKVRIKPGGQAKFAFVFDWASYNEFVKALEVGVMLNVYTGRVPIMLTEDNQFIFPNLYIKLMLGKRW